jgi:hypothetical protein
VDLPDHVLHLQRSVSEDQKQRLEEIKLEISQAAAELRANGDPYAACARVIDAVLLLTAYLETI